MKLYDNDSGVFEIEYDPNIECFVLQVGEGVAGDVATVTLTVDEAENLMLMVSTTLQEEGLV